MFFYHQSSNYCITSPVDACDNGRGEGGEHDHPFICIVNSCLCPLPPSFCSTSAVILTFIVGVLHSLLVSTVVGRLNDCTHQGKKDDGDNHPIPRRHHIGVIGCGSMDWGWCGESGWRPERSSSVIIILTSLTFVVIGLHHTRQRHSPSFHYSEQLFCSKDKLSEASACSKETILY